MPGFQHSPTVLTIDLDAIVENWRIIRNQTHHRNAAAVVKADGYGLGLDRVSRSLAAAGCEMFFVAHLDEGILLSQSLTPTPDTAWDKRPRICVMNGLIPGQEDVYTEYDLWPSLNDLGQIDLWRNHAARQGGALPCVLHIDTGMSRTGLDQAETETLIADTARLAGCDLQFILSHMACADAPDHPLNRLQQQRFADRTSRLPKARMGAMLAASSATFLGPDWHFDWIRPGVALYGVRPNTLAPNPMRPTIRLDARILQVRQIDASDSVGYGASYQVTKPARIATIALGYADGFLRSISNTTAKAWLGKVEVPIVGRVSMDLVTVDVTALPQVAAGDLLSVIGPNQDVDALADAAGTIGYEILTSLGSRFHRNYIGGAA